MKLLVERCLGSCAVLVLFGVAGCGGTSVDAVPANGGAGGGGGEESGIAGTNSKGAGGSGVGGADSGSGGVSSAGTGNVGTGGSGGISNGGSAGSMNLGGFAGGYSFTIPGGGPNDRLLDVAVDSQGRAIAVGGVDGAVTLHGTDYAGGILIVRLDGSGNLDWGAVFGSPEFDNFGYGVAVAPDDSFVVAGTYRTPVTFGDDTLEVTDSFSGPDIFVAKFDANANALWAKGFGSAPYDWCNDVALDASGNVYVTGAITGSVDFGGGMRATSTESPFVLKLDADGNHVYSAVYPDIGEGSIYGSGSAIGVDASGKAWVSGYFKGSVDFGGGPLSRSGDDIGAFLLGLDNVGSHSFSDDFGAAGLHFGSALLVQPDGSLFMAGTAVGIIDFGDGPHGQAYPGDNKGELFAARFTPGPALDWSATKGSTDDYSGRAAVRDPAGTYWVAGELTVANGVYGAPVLVTYDAAGNETDQRIYEGDGGFWGIDTDANGSIYASGMFTSSANFGFGELTGDGGVFVVKFGRE